MSDQQGQLPPKDPHGLCHACNYGNAEPSPDHAALCPRNTSGRQDDLPTRELGEQIKQDVRKYGASMWADGAKAERARIVAAFDQWYSADGHDLLALRSVLEGE